MCERILACFPLDKSKMKGNVKMTEENGAANPDETAPEEEKKDAPAEEAKEEEKDPPAEEPEEAEEEPAEEPKREPRTTPLTRAATSSSSLGGLFAWRQLSTKSIGWRLFY